MARRRVWSHRRVPPREERRERRERTERERSAARVGIEEEWKLEASARVAALGARREHTTGPPADLQAAWGRGGRGAVGLHARRLPKHGKAVQRRGTCDGRERQDRRRQADQAEEECANHNVSESVTWQHRVNREARQHSPQTQKRGTFAYPRLPCPPTPMIVQYTTTLKMMGPPARTLGRCETPTLRFRESGEPRRAQRESGSSRIFLPAGSHGFGRCARTHPPAPVL